MSQKTSALLIAVLAVLLLFALFFAVAGKQKDKPQNSSSAAPSETAATGPSIVPASMPNGFSMEIPPGFTETGSQYIERYFVKNDASIIVTGEKFEIAGGYLKDYVEQVKQQYQATADAFQMVKQERITLADGLACELLEFSYAIIGENVRQDFRCVTAVMLKDSRAYLVTCKSHADTFGGYYQSFRDAIKSIRIADLTESGTTVTETVPATSLVVSVP